MALLKMSGLVIGIMLAGAAIVVSAASAASGTPTVPPTAIDDSQLHGLVAPRGLGARYTFMGSLDQLAGLTGPPPLCG